MSKDILLKQFSGKKIAIIGDLMIDKYIWGNVDRISPEGPIPIVEVSRENYVLGGAANVAANISTLSGEAHLFGVIGNDNAKDVFLEVAKTQNINTNGVLINDEKTTIEKIRVISQGQQLIRIDYEDTKYTDSYSKGQLIEKIEDVNDISVIIVSDYAKGTITEDFMNNIKKYSEETGALIIVDPKPKHKEFYKNVSLITPNKKEAQELTGIFIESEEDIIKCGNMIMEKYNSNVIITRGAEGMSVFEKGKEPAHIDTVAKEVFDVSGAGDTVIATLGMALSSGCSLYEAANIANVAAGIKVEKLGTAPVYLKELDERIK